MAHEIVSKEFQGFSIVDFESAGPRVVSGDVHMALLTGSSSTTTHLQEERGVRW